MEELKEFEALPEDRKKIIRKAIEVATESPWLPYRFGGSSPKDGGFDCSGAMYYVMMEVGIDPPRTSANQYLWLKNEGRLNVLVRSESGGDAMWRPEFTRGAVKLLQLPLNRFGDGSEDASGGFYRSLPSPGTDSYHFQNRFVGNYVLYGTGNSWGRPQDQRSVVVAAAVRGSAVTQLSLAHGIDRIEAMGNDAVVIGAGARDLHFQAVELTSGWRPQLGDRYSLTSASQGETRSHAFFFKPDPRREDETAGLLGLPVARAGRPGHRQLAENSAAIIFLSRSQRKFQPLGELGANEEGVVDDHCQASCADWYGNARPIFLRGRVFALMGYELVEGALERGAISEVRRVNFAPAGR